MHARVQEPEYVPLPDAAGEEVAVGAGVSRVKPGEPAVRAGLARRPEAMRVMESGSFFGKIGINLL